jgi:hypothetical protein
MLYYINIINDKLISKMNSFNKKTKKNELVSNKENFAPLSSFTPKKKVLNNNCDLQEKEI